VRQWRTLAVYAIGVQEIMMANKEEVFRITVVETASFQTRAKSRMEKEEKGKAIEMIAKNPLCGDLMEGTGGVRKVRFAVGNKGKSGGVRIVYYYYNQLLPVFLLTVFAKKEKSNLTKEERNQLADLVKQLREIYQESVKKRVQKRKGRKRGS
jgi:hypothetical protein